jgi:hypothetical protein
MGSEQFCSSFPNLVVPSQAGTHWLYKKLRSPFRREGRQAQRSASMKIALTPFFVLI